MNLQIHDAKHRKFQRGSIHRFRVAICHGSLRGDGQLYHRWDIGYFEGARHVFEACVDRGLKLGSGVGMWSPKQSCRSRRDKVPGHLASGLQHVTHQGMQAVPVSHVRQANSTSRMPTGRMKEIQEERRFPTETMHEIQGGTSCQGMGSGMGEGPCLRQLHGV